MKQISFYCSQGFLPRDSGCSSATILVRLRSKADIMKMTGKNTARTAQNLLDHHISILSANCKDVEAALRASVHLEAKGYEPISDETSLYHRFTRRCDLYTLSLLPKPPPYGPPRNVASFCRLRQALDLHSHCNLETLVDAAEKLCLSIDETTCANDKLRRQVENNRIPIWSDSEDDDASNVATGTHSRSQSPLPRNSVPKASDFESDDSGSEEHYDDGTDSSESNTEGRISPVLVTAILNVQVEAIAPGAERDDTDAEDDDELSLSPSLSVSSPSTPARDNSLVESSLDELPTATSNETPVKEKLSKRKRSSEGVVHPTPSPLPRGYRTC
jgi:hypothetical protein